MDNNITTDIIISIEEYNKPLLPKKILVFKSMHSKDNPPPKQSNYNNNILNSITWNKEKALNRSFCKLF